jgi:hypothetical protein
LASKIFVNLIFLSPPPPNPPGGGLEKINCSIKIIIYLLLENNLKSPSGGFRRLLGE